MKNIDTEQLVTVAGGVARRPDGSTCTDPIRPPTPGPFNPGPGSPFQFPGTVLGGAVGAVAGSSH